MKTISSDYKKPIQEKEWENSCTKARIAAITYIGISKKTSGKVAGWLDKKGYPADVIQYVIDEFIQEGTINDEIIANSILRQRTDSKAESSIALEKRLLRLGVAQEIARKCIEDNYKDSKKELADSVKILHLKFNSKIDTIHEWEQSEQLKFKQKCYRFLLNRGYSGEVAYKAMNIVFKEKTFDE